NPAKARIAGEHSNQIEYYQQRGRSHHSEAAPALLDRQREIRRNPCKESPPGKHAEEIHQQQCERMFRIGRLEDASETRLLGRETSWSFWWPSTWPVAFLPHRRLG